MHLAMCMLRSHAANPPTVKIFACMSGWLLQVGAGEVIQGWDKGILGTDGIPPMKVTTPGASCSG